MKIYQLRELDANSAERLAELCSQLGYPSSPNELIQRMSAILSDTDHAVFVATSRAGIIQGWVHIFSRSLLVHDAAAEIGGLIVDANYRGQHIGEGLMRRAETWAVEMDLEVIYVRSNINRDGAHDFYPAIGYEMLKTSRTYMKSL